MTNATHHQPRKHQKKEASQKVHKVGKYTDSQI
jgi:hypothetical protein